MAGKFHGSFPTTQWSLIASLRGEGEEARSAANILASRYWTPVYAFLLGKGLGHDRAADMTQAFFADVVLGRGLFERARPESGRLRGLVQKSLNNYLIDGYRSTKSRFETAALPLDGVEHDILKPLEGLSPEEAFNKRWALALLHESLGRCEKHFSRPVLAKSWAAFDVWILRRVAGTSRPDAARLAEQTGFRSAHDFHAAVQTVKKRVGSVLRDVVAEQVAPGEDPEVEYREVLALLKSG